MKDHEIAPLDLIEKCGGLNGHRACQGAVQIRSDPFPGTKRWDCQSEGKSAFLATSSTEGIDSRKFYSGGGLLDMATKMLDACCRIGIE